MPHLREPFPLTHSPTVRGREWWIRGHAALPDRGAKGTSALWPPAWPPPHTEEAICLPQPPFPSPLSHPTPAPNILGPTVTIQPGVDQCKTHNIKVFLKVCLCDCACISRLKNKSCFFAWIASNLLSVHPFLFRDD